MPSEKYSKPALSKYGNISELTMGEGTSSAEDTFARGS